MRATTKKLLILTLTLCLTSTALGQIRDKLKISYDNFKDWTFIRLKIKEIPRAADYEDDYTEISLFVGHQGKEPRRYDGNEIVLLGFYRSGKEWRFLNDHDLQVMCGENHIPVKSTYKSAIDKGRCKETIMTPLKLGDLRLYLEKNQDEGVLSIVEK
jgi:hypothetical protein